ncbi:unnamed protein product [Wuchereria bancrofti]|uniref:Uncharacterized protein n=1 Tax=Wuchereria bancrofti TaxID=6293 RepID=A0A3P7FF09_WUCBA|nr:unnamed protein product [Wuchereria bancrofti]
MPTHSLTIDVPSHPVTSPHECSIEPRRTLGVGVKRPSCVALSLVAFPYCYVMFHALFADEAVMCFSRIPSRELLTLTSRDDLCDNTLALNCYQSFCADNNSEQAIGKIHA